MGGNVFAGSTSNIKCEFITPTLNYYFSELSKLFPKKSHIFNEGCFRTLGSARKKDYSGDIDLGINLSHLLSQLDEPSIQEWNIDYTKVQTTFNELKKRARTSSDEQLKTKAFLKCLADYINNYSPTIYCDEKRVTHGNMFSRCPQIAVDGSMVGAGVQIDWMVGDIEWLTFSYYSADYGAQSNVKGLHRTQLMLAAFQIAGLSFNHVSGVRDKKTMMALASTPEEALKILSARLGVSLLSQANTENYYTLHDLLKRQLASSEYDKLIDVYFKILDSTRADIPDNLVNQWKTRRNELHLTGKFLPETSILRK